jgi:type 1 glutamine amidotransferase
MHASRFFLFLMLAAMTALCAGDATAAEPPAARLKVLVVSGGHGFPVPAFRKVFEGYADMQCTFVDEKVGGEAFEEIDGWDYDVILLYNYMRKPSDKAWNNFNALLDRGVGLVILHHAIYGYRPRPGFIKIVGVTCWLSGAKHGVDIPVHVEDPKHPITRGLKDFTIHDETYAGHKLDPRVHPILTTDMPTNGRGVAWVHTVGKSPVCYFQLGHDAAAYANENFQTILGRAIRWTAGRLGEKADGK